MGKACVPVVPLHPLLCFSMLGLLCVEQDCSGLCSEMWRPWMKNHPALMVCCQQGDHSLLNRTLVYNALLHP